MKVWFKYYKDRATKNFFKLFSLQVWCSNQGLLVLKLPKVVIDYCAIQNQEILTEIYDLLLTVDVANLM